jgi:hypothetical protein
MVDVLQELQELVLFGKRSKLCYNPGQFPGNNRCDSVACRCFVVEGHRLPQSLPSGLLRTILVTHRGCEHISKRLYSFLDIPNLFHVGSGLLQETVSGQRDETLEYTSRRSS